MSSSTPTSPPISPPIALHITRSRHARPAARRVAYCDGGIDAHWRDGVDVELSHWIPNRTPAAYKADTSTEIALRCVEAGGAEGVDLVVNNHVDTDGMLSVFVLLHPELALAHRRTLVQAAAMGDFHAWGDDDAQHLFQLVALSRMRLQKEQTDPQDIYLAVHALVRRALAGERFAETSPGLAALHNALLAVQHSRITRTLLAPRLAHYVLPASTTDRDCLPALDEPIAPNAVLPPQARSHWDAERLQLMSKPQDQGWRHDLCWPGHAWAETVGLWRPAGLSDAGSSNRHHLHHAPLDHACAALNEIEPGLGRWVVAQALAPFEALPGRPFPVVLSFMQNEQPATSALPPTAVAQTLQRFALA